MQYRKGRKPIRMIQRKAARDHAAEGKSDYRRAFNAAAIHQSQELPGEHGEIRPARGRRTLAVPEQVVGQYAEVRRESRDLPLPHGTVEPESVDQHDRRPGSVKFPGGLADIADAHCGLPVMADGPSGARGPVRIDPVLPTRPRATPADPSQRTQTGRTLPRVASWRAPVLPEHRRAHSSMVDAHRFTAACRPPLRPPAARPRASRSPPPNGPADRGGSTRHRRR